MYLVNRDKKLLEPIAKAAFRDVGMRERKDLQEWIVNNPEVFGEDLLIIQQSRASSRRVPTLHKSTRSAA